MIVVKDIYEIHIIFFSILSDFFSKYFSRILSKRVFQIISINKPIAQNNTYTTIPKSICGAPLTQIGGLLLASLICISEQTSLIETKNE